MSAGEHFSLFISFLQAQSVSRVCTQESLRNSHGLTSPDCILLSEAAEFPGEGAASGLQVAAKVATQGAQQGQGPPPRLLLAPRSRLMGPRREGQPFPSAALKMAHWSS